MPPWRSASPRRGIPRQEDPYFPIPIYQIVVAYPGAEPQDIERLVVKPIEDRLSELDDIKKIESHSNDGVAVIQPELYSSVDTEKKYDEVVREINALRPTLPPECEDRDPQIQSRTGQHRAVRAGLAGRALSRARRLRA